MDKLVTLDESDLDRVREKLDSGEMRAFDIPAFALIHVNGIPFYTGDTTELLGNPANIPLAGITPLE